jgi:DNA-directed RNA polymerase specialized sigma54-like protein
LTLAWQLVEIPVVPEMSMLAARGIYEVDDEGFAGKNNHKVQRALASHHRAAAKVVQCKQALHATPADRARPPN